MANAHQTIPDSRTIGEVYLELAEQIRAGFTRAAASQELTFMEARLLRHVAVHDQQAAIVALMGISPPRVSALLRQLEHRQLVQRTEHRGDRRFRTLRLTEAGTATLARLNQVLTEESPLLRWLTLDERRQLHRLVMKMLDHDSEPAGPASAR